MRHFLVVLLLAACDMPFAPYEPEGEPFTPPPIYREWYAEIEACSGLSGNFDQIRFQKADQMRDGGKDYGGFWYPPHTITVRADLTAHQTTVKHEFMHDLLQSGDHPAEYFTRRCGNLIL